jgi:hypothetical protein
LRIDANRKKLKRILFEIYNLRYNDDLYRKEAVSEKAESVTAMKFAHRNNVRIYCKEYFKAIPPGAKNVVMISLYTKKETKSKRIKTLIETIGGYDYDFEK